MNRTLQSLISLTSSKVGILNHETFPSKFWINYRRKKMLNSSENVLGLRHFRFDNSSSTFNLNCNAFAPICYHYIVRKRVIGIIVSFWTIIM